MTRSGSEPFNSEILARFAWAASLSSEQLDDSALEDRITASYRESNYRRPDAVVENRMIDGPLGSNTLHIRIYSRSQNSNASRPALVWAHGGGWIGGDLEMQEADGVARELVARTDSVIVSVNYHLADGTIGYPNLHHELSAAYNWTVQHSHQLGVDSRRVLLGGASAGANLALGSTLEARDTGGNVPSALILVYPALHETLSPFADGPDLSMLPSILRLSQTGLDQMYGTYTQSSPGDTRYSSIGTNSLRGLPLTLTIVAEYDDLRGSADQFVESARADGVTVLEHLAHGMPHGYLEMSAMLTEAKSSLDRVGQFILSAPVMYQQPAISPDRE